MSFLRAIPFPIPCPLSSHLRIACAVLLAGSLAGGCSATGHSGTSGASAQAAVSTSAEPAANASGLLSDYSLLRPSDQYASVLVYRDDAVRKGYQKLFFRPVEVWRAGSEQLQDIPEQDLQYLADSFYRAMVTTVGKHFTLVAAPGPGVLEIALGLTLVADEKQPVDTFSTAVPVPDLPARTAPLAEATRRFVRNCALEAEFAEALPSPGHTARPVPAPGRSAASPPRPVAAKRVIRAAFFDARRGAETPKGAVETWADVDAVFAKWAGFLDSQLVALREGTFQPKLTVHGSKPPAPR